jgi:hypothetical protein
VNGCLSADRTLDRTLRLWVRSVVSTCSRGWGSTEHAPSTIAGTTQELGMIGHWGSHDQTLPLCVRSTTERVQRDFLLTGRVRSWWTWRCPGSVLCNGFLTMLASCSYWLLTRHVRSLRQAGLVTSNLLSWTPTGMFWSGEYKYFSYSSNLALLPICSTKETICSARKSKSLVGWLRFDNPRLRTSLVHRE